MRAIATLVLCLLLLTSGCSGFLSGQGNNTPEPTDASTSHETPEKTPTPTNTPSATETSSSTDTKTSTPSYAELVGADEEDLERDDTPEPPNNPWGEKEVLVGFRNHTDRDRNFKPAAREAVEYWNDMADEYTSHDVNFTFRPDLSPGHADVEIVASEPIEYCGGPVDDEYLTLGCYRSQTRLLVFANQTRLQFRNTAIHELGHALGQSHHDEPLWSMSVPDLSYSGSLTNASERENPFNVTDQLHVAIADSVPNRDRYDDELEEALSYYERNTEYLPSGIGIEVVDEPYKAHIVFRGPSETEYEFDGPGSVSYTSGLNYDSDIEFEQWTEYTVYTNEIEEYDTERLFGYWIGAAMGLEENELPPRYG